MSSRRWSASLLLLLSFWPMMAFALERDAQLHRLMGNSSRSSQDIRDLGYPQRRTTFMSALLDRMRRWVIGGPMGLGWRAVRTRLQSCILRDWQQWLLSDAREPEVVWAPSSATCHWMPHAALSVWAVVVLGFTCDHVNAEPSPPLENRIISAAHRLDDLMNRPAGADPSRLGERRGARPPAGTHFCLIFSGGRPVGEGQPAQSSAQRPATIAGEEAGKEEALSEAAIMERCFRRLVLAHPVRWRVRSGSLTILLEETSTSTHTNALHSLETLDRHLEKETLAMEHQQAPPRTMHLVVEVVTSPYHQLRSRRVFHRLLRAWSREHTCGAGAGGEASKMFYNLSSVSLGVPAYRNSVVGNVEGGEGCGEEGGGAGWEAWQSAETSHGAASAAVAHSSERGSPPSSSLCHRLLPAYRGADHNETQYMWFREVGAILYYFYKGYL